MLSTLYITSELVFIFLDALILAALIFVIVESWKFRLKFGRRGRRGKKVLTLGVEILRERWHSAIKRFDSGTAESRKMAIIEADKIADDILKRFGLEGEHMADRLDKITRDDLKSLDRLWRAHRLRNRIVHEPTFEISEAQTEQAMGDYQSFLKEIGIV